MLTVATLKSPSQASNYYEHADYYTKEEQQNNSCWFGVGAKNLKLEGTVDPDIFKKLLQGELPDGTLMQKGYNAKGQEKRRPGYDLTFSAPKSVSILAFKDPRIIDAHNKAVTATLEEIEQQAAARVKVRGVTTNKLTKNLVVGTFLHNVSRMLDPDLHTHCVVVNMTEINGKYRSIYGDDFYHSKKSLGLEYRLELAQNLMRLGYELEQTSKEGFFEIKGVPKTVIKQLSKRRQEIEQVLQEKDLDSQQKVTMVLHKGTSYERTINTVASSMANFITREQKTFANIDELQAMWDQEVVEVGGSVTDLENIVQQSYQRGPIKIKSQEEQIVAALPMAIKHLSEQKAIFSRKELLFAVKAFCVTSLPDHAYVEKIIIKHINEKELIPLEGDRFTTAYTVQLEKNNILTMQQQQESCSAILPIGAKLVAKLLKEPNQRAALHMLLASKDRFVAIDAYRELEQRQVLKVFNRVALTTKTYVIAPKHEQAKKFANAIGVERAFSLNGFLYYARDLIQEKALKNLSNNVYSHVWLLSRSHMLTNKDLAKIEEYAIKLNAKVVFVGDRMRQGSRDRGVAFRSLLDNGIKQVNLAVNDLDHLSLLREQKVQEAMLHMAATGSLIAIADREARATAAVEFAVNNDAILITQNTIDQQSCNELIRNKMQAQGKLSGASLKAAVLVPIYLSNTQKQSLANYQIGDLIRFNKGLQNTIYTQGTYFTVIAIDHNNNQLSLEKNGTCYSLSINDQIYKKFSLYRPGSRELKIGDQLMWNDNTPRELEINRDFTKSTAKVIKIEQNQQIELMLENHKTFTIDLTKQENQHIEYAYTQTLNGVAYKEVNKGVILLNNNLEKLSLTAIYTALSAIKETSKIYCNNIEGLQQAMQDVGLKEYAHLQTPVALERNSQHNPFAKIKGELEGNLAGYSTMLSAIVPEINLLGNQSHKEAATNQSAEYLQAIEAVNFAVTKLAEREAVFSGRELIYVAKKYDIKIARDLVKTAINQAIAEGWLINKGEDRFLTKEVYAMECACLKIQKQGEGALEPMVSSNSVLDEIKEHKYFTTAQKQAILLIASSSDRINLVQGIAGSGKTSMLKEVKRLARDAGFELLGVTNMASAKNNLQTKTKELETAGLVDAGIPSRTLASFLNEATKILNSNHILAKQIYPKNTLFILDEASLVSIRDMFTFNYIVEKLEARATILGDNKQLPSIEASHSFRLLLGTSNSKVVMNINTRLKTKEALQLMQDIYAARIDDAFDKLLNNLIEIPNRAERLQAMANYYLAASKTERAEIMPMLPLNKDRVEFNNLVRAGLKKEGTLTGVEIHSPILVAKDLTSPETSYSLSFEVNDLVKFNHTIKRLGINKGDLLVVTGHQDRQVLLLDQNSNNISWDPTRFATYFKGAVEVYTKEIRFVMAGDLIRWTRNDEERGIVNSETAEVINVKQQIATVKLNNGKVLDLDLSKPINQHWDHAYGSTVHVVQGLDKYNPIGQGLGSAPRMLKGNEVQIGDQIVIPGNNKDPSSKVGKVIDLVAGAKEVEVVAIDRLNQEHRFSQERVAVYPDFKQAKPPKISSLESLVVMATRGDKLVMFVDNIEGYKAAVTCNQNLKQTALEIMLPKVGIAIQEQVKLMTKDVYGLADLPAINQSIKNNKENTAVNNKIAKTIKDNNAKILATSTKISLNFNKSKTQLARPKFDLSHIKQELAKDVLSHVSSWRGKPDQITHREARWGKKGSFSVILSGPKRGTWADFEAGAAGRDLVSLYMYTFNYSKGSLPEVLQDLANKVGVEAINKINHYQKNSNKDPKLTLERAKYINKVVKLYESAVPIKNTLGAKYCYQYRGIKGKLPDPFRFKARCWHEELKTYRPALIVPGYDPNGKLQSVNRIYLNDDGSKLKESFTDQQGVLQAATAKRNYGPTLGATIKINQNPNSDITMVTEGVENALSIKEVFKDVNIISSFGVGQLKNLTIEPGTKTIILCADNDGMSTNTKTAVVDALQKWQEQGYQVKLAMPFAQDLTKKIDFNDLLKQHGERAVHQAVSKAIDISDLSSFSNKSSPLTQDFIKTQNKQQINCTEFSQKNMLVASKSQQSLNELSL